MDYTIGIFSILFFLVIFIYSFFGICVIRLNPKTPTNKLFLLSCMMSIWSLGYAMTNAALDAKTAVLWMRFSAIGKMLFFSTVLHFMLLLGEKEAKIMGKKRDMLIYIPALINIYIFLFLTPWHLFNII